MQNKNIKIYVFSGTGNTLLIANKISEVLNNNSCVSTVYRMEASNPKTINLDFTIGIGFTVACWNTFPFVRKWINDLPAANGTEVFLFNSMGDSSLRMIAHLSKILLEKGYKVIASSEFVMPNNFLLVENDKKKELKLSKTMPKVEDFAKSIVNGTCSVVKPNIISSIFFPITTIIIYSWKFKIWQKIIKFKIDKNKCNKCKVCIDICPVGNISMKEYPEFSMHCQFCLRCISYCPQKAMQSHLLYKNKTHKALSLGDIQWK